MTAVSPGSMRSSVGSTKDLKPEILSLVNFNGKRALKRYWLCRLRPALLFYFVIQPGPSALIPPRAVNERPGVIRREILAPAFSQTAISSAPEAHPGIS
jgi:hypothetical protein